MTERYFLTRGEGDETEVSRDDFIRAERNAGFRPKCASDHPDYRTTLATGGFGGCGVSGRIETTPDNEE